MARELLLALAASFCTAFSSVAQRIAASPAPGELSLSLGLIKYLIRRPVWFLGIGAMIAGFIFQILALKVGELAIVQPVIAVELLFVFGFMAARRHGRVHRGDWLSALCLAAGLSMFLFLSDPSGGRDHATTGMWVLAGASVIIVASLIALAARFPTPNHHTKARAAALYGIAAAIMWGFVAAVIKELSGHLHLGLWNIVTSWPIYVLLGAGAFAFFLASNAFQAGPLAASQPALTIVDPLVASGLGVVLFSEHLSHTPSDVVGEVAAVLLLIIGVIGLSRSALVHPEQDPSHQAPVPGVPPSPSETQLEAL